MHEGMGANKKITKHKLSFCKRCLALRAGHLKNSAAFAAGKAELKAAA